MERKVTDVHADPPRTDGRFASSEGPNPRPRPKCSSVSETEAFSCRRCRCWFWCRCRCGRGPRSVLRFRGRLSSLPALARGLSPLGIETYHERLDARHHRVEVGALEVAHHRDRETALGQQSERGPRSGLAAVVGYLEFSAPLLDEPAEAVAGRASVRGLSGRPHLL